MPKKSRYEQFIDSIIEEEGFLEHPKNIGDGVITLGSGLTAKKWHDLYKKRGNKWSKKDNRIAVMEEIENARKRVKQHIKNFDKLPKDAQEVILDIEYNTGAVNPKSSPNFVKAINSGDTAEAARQMDWGNTDPTFGNGLRKRNQRRAEKFLNSFDGKITTINTDNGKKMIFPLPDWAKGEKRLPNTVVPKSPSQDFPLSPEDRTAPSLDSWNGANSPAYGGNTPRIKGIQEYMNDQQNELNHVLPGTLAIDNQPTASIFPSLDQLMSYGKELFVRDITGAPSIYDNALNNPTINKFLIPTVYANKGKDLPNVGSIVSYKPGTGRKLYDSGILAAQQDLGVPGIISGDKLLMFPQTYSTWKHFPNKQLLGKYGKHTNGSVFTQNGNVYLLNEPSLYVPTKHEYMFDPSIIDAAGNMHVDLGNPSIFNALYPTIGGAALYNNIYTEGLGDYNKGKDIYIKPSKRGTFTAAAKKHGKSVQEFASQVLANPGNYSPAMRKKALFARNAKKWKH